MTLYQGRAITAAAPRRRGGGGRLRRIAWALAAVAVIVALAHLPWMAMRRSVAVLKDVHVSGLHYLDARGVATIAGLTPGQDLFALDLIRSRQRLLLHPRVATAEVTRRWPRGVDVRITERLPVLLVRHGAPWEMDSTGVLLEPLADGVVADVPLLSGVDFSERAAGSRISTEEVERGLAWVRALSVSQLQLAGQVSELEVSDPQVTRLVLMNGTHVLTPAEPPGLRTLSALRVVLADLHAKGAVAREIDLRFDNQVIVRPAPGTDAATLAASPATAPALAAASVAGHDRHDSGVGTDAPGSAGLLDPIR